jgi:HPt (histidine-containing phosphotransfer) domain-containing protein
MNQDLYIADNRLPDMTEGSSHWILPEMLLDLAMDGSPDLIADLIEAFRTDTQLRLKQVCCALGDGDQASIRAAVHSIKGSAQQMGANVVASMCLDIELYVGALSAVQFSQCLKGLEAEFEEVCHAMDAYSVVHPDGPHRTIVEPAAEEKTRRLREELCS